MWCACCRGSSAPASSETQSEQQQQPNMGNTQDTRSGKDAVPGSSAGTASSKAPGSEPTVAAPQTVPAPANATDEKRRADLECIHAATHELGKLDLTQNVSQLQLLRRNWQCELPQSLRVPAAFLEAATLSEDRGDNDDEDANKKEQLERTESGCVWGYFPHTWSRWGQVQLQPAKHLHLPSIHSKHQQSLPMNIGVVFSGGPAPGAHNVVCGMFGSRLFGFMGGPKGVMNGDYMELEECTVRSYYNQGGFTLLGTGRNKIASQQDMQDALCMCKKLSLDGLVIVGGDDSNTNAAMLAEYFEGENAKTRVIGVPKTIDGDMKNQHIPISFGFDTASKTYSEIVGNLMEDARSANKYYHFVRLMGRAASHQTLECALQTHPQITLIGEEVAAKGSTLTSIVTDIADLVCQRANTNLSHGLILLSEGLIDFIPEMHTLLSELNDLLASNSALEVEKAIPKLSEKSRKVFTFLPKKFQRELMLDRDPHGNIQLSRIETERLLIPLVKKELAARAAVRKFAGTFSAQSHFLGYEGRCGLPSNFDCTYCMSLGHCAVALVALGFNGMMATVRNPWAPVSQWSVGGSPITHMMHMERRKGITQPVVCKATVDLQGAVFKKFASQREKWATDDSYRNPGPIQFFGPSANDITMTLQLEAASKLQ